VNQKKLVLALLAIVGLVIGLALLFMSQIEPDAKEPEVVAPVSAPMIDVAATPAKTAKKPEARSRWVRVGPGTVVGVLREFGSDRPIEGAEITLEAGLPGPNELLRTTTRADGGFTFDKVTNFEEWTLRAKAPPPLADTELAGVAVVEAKQTDLGTVYLAPAFGVPGIVVDEKDTPIAGATVRAIRGRPASSTFDLLRLIRELPARPAAVDSATSGPDGKFELRKVPPGRYDFTVEKAGYQIKVHTGEIVNPEAKDRPLKFVLVRGFQLDGRVVREGGGPVNAIPVVAFKEPNDPAEFNTLDKCFATTDEKGDFKIDGLGAGRFIVAVTPEGEPAVATSDVTVPSKKVIEIVLKGDCWLEGRVTGEEDRPVPDAQVYAINVDSRTPTVGNTKTDADGKYVIRGLRSGPLQMFLVQAEGYGNYPEDVMSLMRGRGGSDVKLAPGRNERNVSLAKGGIVRGLVKEKDGDTPIAGARVELGTPLAFVGGNRGATTGPDGKFELTGVGKGSAVLMVSKDGWFQPGINPQSVLMMLGARMQGGKDTGKDTGKGATIVISEPGEVVERTIELSRGSSLSGTVMSPDGQPVVGAQVSLAMEDEASGFGRMLGGLFPTPDPRLTDAQGHYEIPGPPPGQKARVTARAPGYLDGRTEPMTCAAGDTKTGVDVKLRVGATLAGKVRDDKGSPIEGALVRWIAPGEDTNEWSVRWRLRSASPTITDDKGEFRILNVETGTLVVQVTDERHLPWSSKDVKAEDAKSTDLDVKLALGAVISGQVLGSDGRPAANATVSWDFQGQRDSDFTNDREEASCDGNGNFRAEGLAAGSYELQARSPGAAPSDPVVAAAGGAPVTLRLSQAFTITGVVRMKSGAGVGDVEVNLLKQVQAASADGKDTSTQTREVQDTRTSASGAFELKDVPAGTYDIRIALGWGASPRPNIVPTTISGIQAGRQDLVIEVDPGMTITGSVFGDGGQPASGGWIWGSRQDPQNSGEYVNAQIEADGTFELNGLAPGKYNVTFSIEGGGQKSRVLEAGAKDVRVEFGGGGSIKVRVLKEDGTAAATVWVSANGEQGGGGASTDAEGRAEIKGLGEGTYNVHAFQAGGQPAMQEGVVVKTGGATDVELKFVKKE
jgi:hypothetical protein